MRVTLPKIWKKPNPKLFSDTKFFRHRIHYFLIPNFFYTESDTFFSKLNFLILNPKPIKNGKVSKPRSFKTETLPKITQIWTKLNPKLFRIPNFFDTESDTFFETKKFRYRPNPKLSKKLKSFETEKFRKPKRYQKYPKSERNWIRNFFGYQIFLISNSILF